MVAFTMMMRQQFLKRLVGLGAAVTTTPTISITTTGLRNGFSQPLGTAHLDEFRGQTRGFRCGSPSFSEMAMVGASPFIRLLPLNDLRDNKGSRKKKTRKGRGIGSGKGKTAGRGHKGQKARGSYKFGFEGGQTPLRRLLPRRGFKNRFSLTFQPVSLRKIARLINAGRIDSSELITMKTLKDVQAVGKQIKDGVRLMGRGAEEIHWPIHIEVTRVTARAKEAVEAAGGSVRRVYYNRLGLKALLKPEWFEKKGRLLPRPARPPPKQRSKVDSIGRLPAPTTPLPLENAQTSTQA